MGKKAGLGSMELSRFRTQSFPLRTSGCVCRLALPSFMSAISPSRNYSLVQTSGWWREELLFSTGKCLLLVLCFESQMEGARRDGWLS